MQNIDSVREFYEKNIYGKWRSGEKVSYLVIDVCKRVVEESDNPFVNMFRLSTTDEGRDVEIYVENNGKKVCFTVRAYVPSGNKKGRPFIVCMHPVLPKEYILERGCGLIFLDTSMVAEDNNLRKGCFYDLYPYGDEPESQTGELMAWGWAAAKVLDAMYNGLGTELGFDPKLSMVTGVSRWGKATAVCAAFESRFKIAIPVCSGAGGLALWNCRSEGKSYDLTMCGGPADYVYTKNEPLDCLQSEAEQGWFNDSFLQYKSYAEILVEQYMLPVLAADKERFYFIVAAWMGEDWVNAPAMWECYRKSLQIYQDMGLENHLQAHFHKEGHALIQSDAEFILDFLKTEGWDF